MIRDATDDDLETLVAMERAASSAALGHIFDPRLPYPVDQVRATWRLRLTDPACHLAVLTDEGVPVGYACVADEWLLHFGVVPDRWGTGAATTLHAHALTLIADRGHPSARLWVLRDNHRARRFYAKHGWTETGEAQESAYSPHPVNIELIHRSGGD